MVQKSKTATAAPAPAPATSTAVAVDTAKRVEAKLVDPLQERAKDKLVNACHVVRTETMRLGRKQAPIVRAVMECLDTNVRRVEISSIIGEHLGMTEGSRDLGARYIDLARWEMGQLNAGETPTTEALAIAGESYDSPLAALESGKTTFRMVYETWRVAVRMAAKAAVQPPATNMVEGAAAVLTKTQVRYETQPDAAGNVKPIRMRLLDNPQNKEEVATPEAWASGLLGMLNGAKAAKLVLGEDLYAEVHNRVTGFLEGEFDEPARPARPMPTAAEVRQRRSA
jgi:hypothetical protein